VEKGKCGLDGITPGQIVKKEVIKDGEGKLRLGNSPLYDCLLPRGHDRGKTVVILFSHPSTDWGTKLALNGGAAGRRCEKIYRRTVTGKRIGFNGKKEKKSIGRSGTFCDLTKKVLGRATVKRESTRATKHFRQKRREF